MTTDPARAWRVPLVAMYAPPRMLRAIRGRLLTMADLLSSLRFRMFRAFYYRFLFGHEHWVAARLSEIVFAAERERHKGDVPEAPETWDSQYRAGHWGDLARVEEAARYGPIVAYLTSLKPGGTILDVGCGEGLLQTRLRRRDYSRYVGIDISEAAISRASQRMDARAVYVRADAAMYTPQVTFDTIVFNEALYYFHEPVAVFERYARYLKPGGILVTSLYRRSVRANSIRRLLKARFTTLGETTTATGPHSWTCTVFQGRF